MTSPTVTSPGVARGTYENILWRVERWGAILGFVLAVPLLYFFARSLTFGALLLSFVFMLVAGGLAQLLQERCRKGQELIDAGQDSNPAIEVKLRRLRSIAIAFKSAASGLSGVVAASAVLSVFHWVK